MNLSKTVLAAITVAVIGAAALGVCLLQGKSTENRELAQRVNELEKQLQADADGRATEKLAALSFDSNPKVRRNSIALIAEWKPDRALKILPEILQKESDASCLLTALDIAGKLKAVSALPEVKRLIASEVVAVSQKASLASAELAGEFSEAEQAAIAESVIGALQKHKALADASIVTPYIDALGMLKSNKAFPVLIEMFGGSKPPSIKRRIVAAMKHVAQKSDAEALLAVWKKEPDAAVRAGIQELLINEPFKMKTDKQGHILVPVRN